MQTMTTIGLDIAKSVFQVHGVDAGGQVIVRRQLKRHLQLKLRLLRLAAKQQLRGLFPGGRGYSSKRSSESRQICDHVSMVSRRASNSFFARNVSPVIIASRFSTFGSASLKT